MYKILVKKHLPGALSIKKVSMLIIIPFCKILTVTYTMAHCDRYMQCKDICNKTTLLRCF